MRRTASVILFILGGWLLAAELMMACMDLGQGDSVSLVMVGIMLAFAAPFLLLGMWASPGNRFADLGLTLMIVACVGAAIALMMVLVLNDPGFKQLMPPGKPMPQFRFAPLVGTVNLLIVGGAGYALWRFGRYRAQQAEPDLERIFGDG